MQQKCCAIGESLQNNLVDTCLKISMNKIRLCDGDQWMAVLFFFFKAILSNQMGFLGGSDSKESTSNAGDLGSPPGLGRPPGGGHGNPLQYSCLENPHGQRSLAGCSPRGCKELDTTKHIPVKVMLRARSSRSLEMSGWERLGFQPRWCFLRFPWSFLNPDITEYSRLELFSPGCPLALKFASHIRAQLVSSHQILGLEILLTQTKWRQRENSVPRFMLL